MAKLIDEIKSGLKKINLRISALFSFLARYNKGSLIFNETENDNGQK